jgi:hypothetical protein
MNNFIIGVSLGLFLSGTLAAAKPEVIFQDRFDGKLGEGWSWIRENPQNWRIKGKGLEIKVEPGVAETVKNALVRTAPDRSKRKYSVEVTVTFTTPPTNQYEQAGITWYHRGKPLFKLVHERIDGKLYVIPGKVPADMDTVQLRVSVSADKFIAQFRPNEKSAWKTVGEGKMPPPGKEQISLQCYNGPANAEHWMRFENFRIVERQK